MSSIKQPSHPFEITTISEVLEESPPDLSPGRLYGNFDCTAAISCGGIRGNDPKDIALKVSANTSRNFALVAQTLYSLKLRLVKNPKNSTYTGYYTPGQPALLGDPERVDVDMTNKIVADSFGLIIKRAEIPASTSGEGDTTLSCTIRHTDWDSEVSSFLNNPKGGKTCQTICLNAQAKQHVVFDVIYVVKKKGGSANIFGLFQLGREVRILGILVDWDDETGHWVVLVNSVSVSTGYKAAKDITVMNQPSPQQNGNRKRRLVNLIPSNPSTTGSSASSGNDSSSLCDLNISRNNNALSGPLFATFDDDIPHIKVEKEVHPITAESEQGEITEASDLPFQNTHAQKRTQSSVLSNARKRLKIANR
ncbi:hypothetical protein O181_025500 [Austropuccinia psidii MF-1]|uniref:Uncharacterized protein n=1 Tax=Austropuccinia psidii MF-1 TaxID=1389203 RepID=A0A9Q3H177_9BASI|nr:hypothetical protein [Austropuccinia psidii MF-1]